MARASSGVDRDVIKFKIYFGKKSLGLVEGWGLESEGQRRAPPGFLLSAAGQMAAPYLETGGRKEASHARCPGLSTPGPQAHQAGPKEGTCPSASFLKTQSGGTGRGGRRLTSGLKG